MKHFRLSPKGFILIMITLCIILLILIFLASFSGAVKVTPGGILKSLSLSLFEKGIPDTGEETQIIMRRARIFFELRLSRIILAGLAGAGLAVTGVVFQSVFRNPMADSYLLGVSSGASLGAALFFLIEGFIFEGLSLGTGAVSGFKSGEILLFFRSVGVSGAAFIGGLIAVTVVLFISGRRSGNIVSLLLTGIAFGMIAQAGVSLVMISGKEEMKQIVFWMMGSFKNGDLFSVLTLFLISVPTIIFILCKGEVLNLLSMGSEEAHSMGINPEKEGKNLLIAASLLTSAIVAFTGVIGFVGLLVPHGVRIISGSDNRRLLPLCLPVGSILMILSDLLSRVIAVPNEIPVGIITSLLGGPLFLVLLHSRFSGRGRS